MCGRYASSKSTGELVDEFEVDEVRVLSELAPSYNVAPTDEVYVVLERAVEADRTRQLRSVRWGLVPSWSKDRRGAARMINARVETVAEKPAFWKAFATRRCLVPADGYFEWYTSASGAKQPFYIRPEHGSLPMAGLYEMWRDPSAPAEDQWLWTCTVITTTATDDLGRIHDRMPMVIAPDDWAEWLSADPVSIDLLLQPSGLRASPVSPAVGNVRNNGPELIVPIEVSTDGY